MDRDFYKGMSCFKQLFTNGSVFEKESPEIIYSDSDLDRIIREIFSVDENTGLPIGDIAYYMSPNGNPQVKEWIMNNLLRPSGRINSSVPDGVDDDVLAEFARGKEESVFDYASRLRSIYDEATYYIEKNKTKPEAILPIAPIPLDTKLGFN